MRSDTPIDKRTYEHRKTIPETGKLRNKKIGFNRDSVLKKAGYRSQFELNIAQTLAKRGVKFEYESKKLVYIPDPRTYTPDFYIVSTDVYIEAKGHLDKADRVKLLLVKKQYPDIDLRLLFMNCKNKIYRGSKTTYAMWATRYNFEWAEGSIPSDWLKNGHR